MQETGDVRIGFHASQIITQISHSVPHSNRSIPTRRPNQFLVVS